MAATAGTMTLLGKSGRTYTVDIYVPDATGTQITFNPAGLAASTSPTTFRTQEDCAIIDISGAAPTAVGFTVQVDSAPVTGGALRWANQLATLATRQKLNIGVRAGSFIGALQF